MCVCVFVHVWVRCNPGISTVPQKEGGNSGKSGSSYRDTTSFTIAGNFEGRERGSLWLGEGRERVRVKCV